MRKAAPVPLKADAAPDVDSASVGAPFFSWAPAAILLLSACAASTAPEIVSIPQPGVRPAAYLDQISDYRTAATTIAAIFDRDLGFASFPITVRLYPGREPFERALLASGYDAALARRTAATMAAVGGRRGVLVNSDSLALMAWRDRVALLAHEFGHSVQYELAGGRRGASDQWLREGFADWIAMRVLEKLGDGSVKDVRRDRERTVRATGRSKTPRLDQLVTFPQWVEAGEHHQGTAAYAVAFVAVDFLLERHGVPAAIDYFKRFTTSRDRAGNFRAAFGEDFNSFDTALSARLWRR